MHRFNEGSVDHVKRIIHQSYLAGIVERVGLEQQQMEMFALSEQVMGVSAAIAEWLHQQGYHKMHQALDPIMRSGFWCVSDHFNEDAKLACSKEAAEVAFRHKCKKVA